MSLMSEVGQKAFNLGVPIAVHMDVTYRCNERCVHCYLDHDDHGELTTAEIKDALDQMAEAGVFFLTFSGGEVFLRRDFFELVEYARRLMFNVKIKTNAVMIHEEEARRIRELGVDTVQISVYSHRPEVHDAITKLPHSFDRTIKAIRFLREQGLRVTIANVLMTANSPIILVYKRWPPNSACITHLIRRSHRRWTATHRFSLCVFRARNSTMYSATLRWWEIWKSFVLLPRRRRGGP